VDPVAAARARRRFAYLVAFLVLTGAIAVQVLRGAELTPEAVRATVQGWGALAPLAFIGLLAARPFVFFPSTLLFIAGGLAFGPLRGTIYAVIGGTTAAIVSFLLARWLGREYVQARLPPSWQRLQRDEWGAGAVFFLNLVPIFPITAVNYGAGLSRVPLRHYALAVIGGLTPRAFAYSYFGDALLEEGSTKIVMAVVMLVLLVVVPAWLRKRIVTR
jgi:uncharacterized membrane protein YdjX (TVP38/TMEM64 family)